MPAVALADERRQHAVLVGGGPHPIEHAAFGQRRAENRAVTSGGSPPARALNDQLIETFYADNAQHLDHLVGRRPDVTTIGEIVGLISLGGGHEDTAYSISFL